MITHPRVADTAAAVSGGSFLTAHWFLVTDHLVHLGASVVTIITGLAAAGFYAERAYLWLKGRFKK